MLNNNQGGIDLAGTRSFAQFAAAGGVQQNANSGFQMGGGARTLTANPSQPPCRQHPLCARRPRAESRRAEC